MAMALLPHSPRINQIIAPGFSSFHSEFIFIFHTVPLLMAYHAPDSMHSCYSTSTSSQTHYMSLVSKQRHGQKDITELNTVRAPSWRWITFFFSSALSLVWLHPSSRVGVWLKVYIYGILFIKLFIPISNMHLLWNPLFTFLILTYFEILYLHF